MTSEFHSSENKSPLIDEQQLRLITDGNPDDTRHLVEVYLRETETDLKELRGAIESGHTNEVHRLAHGCVGASLSYGMTVMVPTMQQLETDAKNGDIKDAAALLAQADLEFQRLKSFLASYLNSIPALKAA